MKGKFIPDDWMPPETKEGQYIHPMAEIEYIEDRSIPFESWEWLQGYYPPEIEGSFKEWSERWSMGPCAEVGWVWFNGEFTEERVKEILSKPEIWRIATSEDVK